MRRAYPVGLGAYPVGFEGKISIAALDIFNGGVKKSSNGGIGKGQWEHWSGSMVALVRVNGGIEKGQLEALVRVNGGIGQGQWGY